MHDFLSAFSLLFIFMVLMLINKNNILIHENQTRIIFPDMFLYRATIVADEVVLDLLCFLGANAYKM